jgi:hypothetical protein
LGVKTPKLFCLLELHFLRNIGMSGMAGLVTQMCPVWQAYTILENNITILYMCEKDWSDYKTAKAFYKSCGDKEPPKYDIADFKKKMSKIKKELEKERIYVIYVGWAGVGTEAQYIFDEAYNIIETDKKYKGVDKLKSFKLLYSEDFLYHLTKTGKINLLFDYSFFKTPAEKKEVKKWFDKTADVFKKYFTNKEIKIDKNVINIKLL